jgi:outer membrane protein assembly factor BamB
MIYPLLMFVFGVGILLLPILGMVILFRGFKKQSGRKYSKPVLAVYAALVILLLLASTSDRIINILPDAASRPLSHILISLDMGDSDLYVRLSKNGDKSSIPYLIQALKSESASSDIEDNYMADTILKGLRRITGNDMGSSYEDWEKWWDGNKDKTEEQWWLDAVRREGYPVSGYPDTDSIASIVETIGYKDQELYGKEYLLNNAVFLLSSAGPEQVIPVIADKLTGDASGRFKMGAARSLGAIGVEGIPLLRTLTTADDLNVRNCALFELNRLHRKQMTATPDSNIIHKIDAGYSITYMTGSSDNKSLYFATRADIRRLDLSTGKTMWSFKNSGEAGSELVIHDGKVLFYSFDGMVYCLDASTGSFLWKYQIAGPRPEYHSKITVLGDVAYLGIEDNVWAFEIKSGRVKWTLKGLPRTTLISHSSEHIFVATTKDELLKISKDGKIISRTQIGESPRSLEGDDNMLYVLSFSEPAHFKIYSTGSLSLLHDEPAGKGGILSKAPNGDVIIVSEDKGVRAFDGKSAQLLWSTKEDDYSAFQFIDKYLVVGDELRQPHTGEIVHKYNIPKVRRACLIGENCVLAADKGKLFILRTPTEEIKE